MREPSPHQWNGHKPPRAGLYMRVSTLHQEDGSSLQTQEEGCRRAAIERGYVVEEAHVYHDIESGRILFERPQVIALREAIHRHLIDVVLIYDLDRLMRDQDFLAMLFAEANYAGVEIEPVTTQLDKSPEGTLLRNIFGYVAQKEHEKIRERMMRGQRARATSGKLIPSSKPLYGYQWADEHHSAYVPNEAEAAVVRRIFEWAAAGKTLYAITQELTAAGIPSPSGRPRWNRSTVYSILSNPFYWGEATAYRWQHYPHQTIDRLTGEVRNIRNAYKVRPKEEQIPLPPGVVPALVSAELGAAVQAHLAMNKALAPRNSHHPETTLLRSGFIKCGYCGHNMMATHARGAGYHCLQNGPGMALFIAASIIDTFVWDKVRSIILDPAIIESELKAHQHDPAEGKLEDMDVQIARLEKKQENVARSLELLDNDEAQRPVIAHLNRLALQKRTLETEREQLQQQQVLWKEEQAQLQDLERWCRQVATRLDTFTYEQKRMALRALGIQVRVYRSEHSPRFEVEAHIPLVREGLRGELVEENTFSYVHSADGR